MVLSNKFLTIKRMLDNTRQFHSSRWRKGYEGSGKTTIDIINKNEGQLLIDKCLPMGFKMNDDSLVLGPLAMFPNTLLSWNIKSGNDINEATLSLFTVLDPALDLLVIGLETPYPHNRILEMKKILIKHKIKTEILPVEQACGIFNFLIDDGRHVAGAFIPPLPKTHEKLQKLVSSRQPRNEELVESK